MDGRKCKFRWLKYFMGAIKKKGKISRNEDNKTLCPRGAIGDKRGGAMGRGPPENLLKKDP